MGPIVRRLVVALTLVLLLPAALPAQGKGKGKGREKQAAADAVRFLPRDIDAITVYYGGGTGSLPPGLAKRGGDLPPGLQKQLRRNGQLPPGLQKRLQPFPVDLERRLSPIPVGCRRVTLGTTALLIQDATNVVLDIIDLTRRR